MNFENQPSLIRVFLALKMVLQGLKKLIFGEISHNYQWHSLVRPQAKTGYEINFTKYFYEFKPLRSLAEIKADILALETSSLELEKTVLED